MATSQQLWDPPKFHVSARPGPAPPRNHSLVPIWTCEATEDYSPVPADFPIDPTIFPGAISVQKGQLLYAIDPEKYFPRYCLVSYGDGQLEGFVPGGVLKSGSLLAKPKLLEFGPRATKLRGNSRATGTVLFRTIHDLLLEMKVQRSSLERAGCVESVLEYIDNNGEQLVHIIHDGIDPSLLPIIRNGDATFDTLSETQGIRPSYNDDSIVIYMLFYSDIIDKGHGKNGLYIGKTEHLGHRSSSHWNALLPNSKISGSHYKIARPARGKKLALFSRFSRGTPDISFILQIAEQIAQLLFGSMNPCLFSLTTDGVEEGGTRWYVDSLAAKTLKSLADVVFRKTGWKVPNNVHGCNWTSAITEGRVNRATWLCHDSFDEANNRVLTYTLGGRSKGTVILKEGASIVLISGGGDARGKVVCVISDAQKHGIVKGTRLYPVIEIYVGAGDVTHPVPYGRLPEPGPFSDWQSLNRLGLRIEWQTADGKWRTRYLQATQGLFDYPKKSEQTIPEDKYASNLYRKVSCMFDTFMNVEYNTPTTPSFKKRGPAITIKKVAYNHLRQEIQMTDLPASRTNVPTLVSFKHNAGLLLKLSPTISLGTDTPERGLSTQHPNRTREICDTCQSLRPTLAYREKHKCPTNADRGDPEYGDTQSCSSDQLLRRPCFWHPNIPSRGAQKGTVPASAERLLWRADRDESWEIVAPTHLAMGVQRADDIRGGPAIEETEDDIVVD